MGASPRGWLALLLCAAHGAAAESGPVSRDADTNSTQTGEGHKAVLTLGQAVFRYRGELNLIFLVVVLVTVLLEVGMHYLWHHSKPHSKQLLIHLNKELALLGIVAFGLMTVATASPTEALEERLDLFEWCHIQLFLVAMLAILSHLVLNLLLRWQEHHFEHFEHGSSRLAAGWLAGWAATRQLHFELARYVFNCDRRKFFSKQLMTAKQQEADRVARVASLTVGPAPLRPTSGGVTSDGVELVLEETVPAVSGGSSPQDAVVAGVLGNPLTLATPVPTLRKDAADVRITLVTDSAGDGRQVSNLSLVVDADSPEPMAANTLDYLAAQLQRLRVTPLLVRKLRAAVRDQSAAPDEFSFAQYRIRCARKGLVKLLHIGWLAWALLLVVLTLELLPIQLLQDGSADYLSVHLTCWACLLLGLFSAMWLWVTYCHHKCIQRLAEAALLHYASEGSLADDEWPQRLEPLLSGTHPRLAKRVRNRILVPECTINERLKERQKGLYERSLRAQKKSFAARFRYPRNVMLALQVLMLWMGLYFSLFILTRFGAEGWSAWEVVNWVFGLGVPLVTYMFFLPNIMFHHTFLISVGDMVDLKVMRQIEQEHREKLLNHAHHVQRCRLLGRIRAKLTILAALDVDTWEEAVAVLEAIGRVPSSLSPSASCLLQSCA